MTTLDTCMLMTALNMGNTIIIFGSGLAWKSWRVAVAAIFICIASITLCLAAWAGA